MSEKNTPTTGILSLSIEGVPLERPIVLRNCYSIVKMIQFCCHYNNVNELNANEFPKLYKFNTKTCLYEHWNHKRAMHHMNKNL